MDLQFFNRASASLQFQLEVVRSRNVQCLSFPLTVATLLTSTSWVLYGHQVSDLYIVVRSAYLSRTFSTAPNMYFPFIKQTKKMFSPVWISFRSQTPQESSPASSDFFCFGNLALLLKAHLLTSLFSYEGVRKDQQMGIQGCAKLLPPPFHFFFLCWISWFETQPMRELRILHGWVTKSNFLSVETDRRLFS